MPQTLQQVRPGRAHGDPGPAAIAPVSGANSTGAPRPASYGGRTIGVIAWRQRAPQASFRQRVAGWRARHWRRAVLAWFVLSVAIMAIAAEPRTDFPKAQARPVPAVRTVLRVGGGLTVAGVPLLLIALP